MQLNISIDDDIEREYINKIGKNNSDDEHVIDAMEEYDGDMDEEISNEPLSEDELIAIANDRLNHIKKNKKN
jgi:hypothetical protein